MTWKTKLKITGPSGSSLNFDGELTMAQKDAVIAALDLPGCIIGKSSAEPFGYFKAEPFGWTDCAETDEGARPLFELATVQAVEKQRDELLDEVAKLKSDLHEVQQRRHDEYRVRAIGKAVYRACEELPEGFDLHIELEKGDGTVHLYDQDSEEVTEEFHGDYINHAIDNAINYAIASVKDQFRGATEMMKGSAS